MERLQGKNVLVTGGNSGSVWQPRSRLRKKCADHHHGRDQATLDKAAAQLGKNVIAVRNDAGSVAEGNKLATLLKQRDLMLDAIFINAGMAKLAPFEAVAEEMGMCPSTST